MSESRPNDVGTTQISARGPMTSNIGTLTNYATKEERVSSGRRVQSINHLVGAVYSQSLFFRFTTAQGEDVVDPCTCELHSRRLIPSRLINATGPLRPL